jgi:hypothetical protein
VNEGTDGDGEGEVNEGADGDGEGEVNEGTDEDGEVDEGTDVGDGMSDDLKVFCMGEVLEAL